MNTYKAPIEEIQFVLDELANLPEILKFPAYKDTTPEIVSAILDEASSMAGDILAPINKIGDDTGCRLIDGKVVTADGFAAAYKIFSESGWQSLVCDPQYGGQGLPHLLSAAVNEMWHSANLAFALCPMLTESAIVLLQTYASVELNQLYTTQLISGKWTSTMVLTEPQAGSDLAAIKTQAIPNGDHYLIRGQKIFITWGDHDFSENIIHLVLARLSGAPPGTRGLSLFLIPKILLNKNGSLGEKNDVNIVSLEHKLGIHASPTCVISFGDSQGAVGYLIGEENNGIACMFTMMNHARLAVGVQGMAISERAYQQALDYAKERIQGSDPESAAGPVPIIHHPDVRRMLMMIRSGTEAMRALCYMTAATLDHAHHDENNDEQVKQKEKYAFLTPVVKGWCSEFSVELTSLGIQIHGGMGYVEETGAAQYFRDARIIPIYEGTTGIQARDLVDRKIIRDKGKVLYCFIGEMQHFITIMQACKNEDMRITCNYFQNAVKNLEKATDWLVKNHGENFRNSASVSYNFLMLAGITFGGWQMGRASLVAIHVLESNATNISFYQAKITSVRFYAEQILTRSHYYAETILAGSESIMKLDMEQF